MWLASRIGIFTFFFQLKNLDNNETKTRIKKKQKRNFQETERVNNRRGNS